MLFMLQHKEKQIHNNTLIINYRKDIYISLGTSADERDGV